MSNVHNDARSSFFPNSKTARIKNMKGKQAYQKTESTPQRQTISSRKDADVTIPESIRDFARIKEIATNAPEIDNSEKIALLKEQVANGTYQMDYDAIADKILRQEYS
jgi:negative regulator of flagellin synthesis FlgM